MILLTVGTYPLPFDRLVKAVDRIITKGFIKERLFAQIGPCTYEPKNMEYVKMLPKETFESYFQKASGIISHAGMGIITMALDHEKPILVMPRLKQYGEAVNDHQLPTARKFEELCHVLATYTEEDLPEKIKQLKSFVPRQRKAQPRAVAERIARFIRQIDIGTR